MKSLYDNQDPEKEMLLSNWKFLEERFQIPVEESVEGM